MSGIRVMVVSLLAQEITLKVKPRKLGGNQARYCCGVLGPLPAQKRGTKGSG